MNLFCWLGTLNGGAEQRNLALVRALKKRGAEVTIGLFEKDETLELHQNIVRRRFPTDKLLGWNHYCAGRYVEKHPVDWDAYFCRFFKHHPKAFWFFRISGDITKTRQANILGRVAYRPLLKASLNDLRQADAVVSCSSESNALIDSLGQENVIYSRNFVDTKVFKPNRHAGSGDSFRVVFAGRDDPIKNLPALRAACAKLDDVELVTCGVDSWLDKKTLAEEFNNADLVVLPSFYESYGITVLEALACNTPVLVSHGVTIGRTDVGPYLHTCNTDSHSLMCSIRNILDNDERFKTAEAGGKFVRANYEKKAVLEKESKEVMEHYKKYHAC